MIFTSPIVIGAVVGAAFAYVFKDNAIKEWLSNKSRIGIFKTKIEPEEEMEAFDEEFENTKLVALKSATKKLKKTAESIKEKTTEVFEVTTVKAKETVAWVKEATPGVYEDTTVKVKETVKWVKEKTTEVFKDAVAKVKETDVFKGTTVKAKETIELVKEKAGEALGSAIEKIKRAFEPVNKRYK